MRKLITLLSLLPFLSMAQTKMNFSSACSYFGERLTTDIYTFSSDDEAQTALARITYASGIPTNFKLVAGNVPNACASLRWNPQIQGYDRFIIYNQTFMLRLKNATNDWAALSILAHEVGHHLSGHSLISGGSRPELELEADKFSGFILAKLGANLQQAQLAINTLTTETYSTTHPPKSARLAAIANGWIESGAKTSGNTTITNNNTTRSGKPDLSNRDVYSNLVVKKSDNGGYWLYHPDTEYYLKKDEDYIAIWLGPSMIVYLIEAENYYIIEDYENLRPNYEKKLKFSTTYPAIHIKSPNNGYWLYHKGKYVDSIETLSTNGNIGSQFGYIVLRSRTTGRRFWIPQSTMYYGSYYTVTGVYSE